VLERELLRHSEQANVDALTGLPNRRWIDASLETMFRTQVDPAEPEALVLLDIDRFVSINDTFGRNVGDNILRKFAEVLCDCASEDVSPARWGGGEFAVLVRSGGIDRGIALAERIRTTVEGFVWRSRSSGARIGMATASVGCAFRRADDTVAEFVSRADQALGRAKADGGNRTYAEADFVAAGDVVSGDIGAARTC
jgi:diguanylate cyclase